MTCFWDGILQALDTSDFQVVGCNNRLNRRQLINLLKNNNVETIMWETAVPQTSAVAKSLILSFNPIENSKRVTPRSAIVCRPSGIANPAKLYANPAVRNPTIGGRPTRLINNPKKKAKVTSVMIILCYGS